MKNFKYPGSFQANFRVLGESQSKHDNIIKRSPDVQILAEGGHILSNITNTVGVIVKDSLGLGYENVKGTIIQNGKKLSSFITGKFGITRTVVTPVGEQPIIAELQFPDGSEKTINVGEPEARGATLSVIPYKNTFQIAVMTNPKTLSVIKGSDYKLIVHNGDRLTGMNIKWGESLKSTYLIHNDDLQPGVNIATLFDERNRPIAERMFFNFEGIRRIVTSNVTAKKDIDSVLISVPLVGMNRDSMDYSFFSASILPSQTVAYRPSHNILSATYLKPYLRGNIENGKYYFEEVDRRKKYELDNLLLTQGWSSYDWDEMFAMDIEKVTADFERGVKITAVNRDKESVQFIRYPMKFMGTEMIMMDSASNRFTRSYYPMDEKLQITAYNAKGKAKRPSLFIQYVPDRIPDFKLKEPILPFLLKQQENLTVPNEIRLDNGYELDAVVVEAQKKKEREDRIRSEEFGTVRFLTDSDRARFSSIVQLLRETVVGFNVRLRNGYELVIESFRDGEPAVVIDGVQYRDYSFLGEYRPEEIDYVVIDRGATTRYRNAAGVVKIYTDPSRSSRTTNKDLAEYAFPVSYHQNKQFYRPSYLSMGSDFFRMYGVVDWKPLLTIDDKNTINFNINSAYQQSYLVFLEGITSDGQLISETLSVKVE
jgi:hypothetical protein